VGQSSFSSVTQLVNWTKKKKWIEYKL
jgi:hypothetical protein